MRANVVLRRVAEPPFRPHLQAADIVAEAVEDQPDDDDREHRILPRDNLLRGQINHAKRGDGEHDQHRQ